jgi:RNA polymerase sigma-70 factor (ECF subfamily)
VQVSAHIDSCVSNFAQLGRLTAFLRARYADFSMGEKPSEATDPAVLITAIANGDRDSLAALYDQFAPLLLAIGIRIVGDRAKAEDVLHDVMLEVWRRASDYERRRGSVRAWLCVRMRSRALDRVRAPRNARAVPFEPNADKRVVAAGQTIAADESRLRAALAELPDEQRAVLELGYFEGLSSSEIAERMDTPVGTVKSRVAAALGKLRSRLDPAGGSG